jgi:CRISPR-associated endonuclease Csy4
MNYYLEITLLPNPEVNINFLWSKVFQQIHIGLAEMQNDQRRVPIGVSFPDYKEGDKKSPLGNRCRLFATDEATLVKFDATKWLSRLSDYADDYTKIKPVPKKLTGYAIYQREQPKTNPERLARRYAKRLAKRFPNRDNPDYASVLNNEVELSFKAAPDAPYEKKLLRYCDMPKKKITTPFIRLKSLSSEHTFCLWIKKSLVSVPSVSAYSSYGLSSFATVPEF